MILPKLSLSMIILRLLRSLRTIVLDFLGLGRMKSNLKSKNGVKTQKYLLLQKNYPS